MSARETAIQLSVEIASNPSGLRHLTLERHSKFIDAIIAAINETNPPTPRVCKRCERLALENATLKNELVKERSLRLEAQRSMRKLNTEP